MEIFNFCSFAAIWK